MLLASVAVVPGENIRLTSDSSSILYVGGSGPGNYTRIQDAIDNASDGDTVFVYTGTYYEYIVIDKTINLVGEDKNTTIIDGGGESDNIIEITAEMTNFSGFTIQNNSFDEHINTKHGIFLESNHTKISEVIIKNTPSGIMCISNNNSIINNSFTNNTLFGIVVYGENNTINNNTFINDGIGLDYNAPMQKSVKHNTINGKPIVYLQNQSNQIISNAGQVILGNCDNITVKDLHISNITYPIQIFRAENISFVNNTVINGFYGLYTDHSDNILIKNNVMNDLICGVASSNNGRIEIVDNLIENMHVTGGFPYSALWVIGVLLMHSRSNVIISNNTFNDIHSNYMDMDNGGAILINYHERRNDILNKGNNINNTGHGIYISYASNTIIQSNTITNVTECGINLYESLNGTIHNCDISNSGTAIKLNGYYLPSSHNTISNCNIVGNHYGIRLENSSGNIIYNNYFDNINNVYDTGDNTWNISRTPGANIIGGNYLAGNYWSDYNGVDENMDGIGDTPYNILGGNNKDLYPLVYNSIDMIPPSIKITKPKKGFYLFNNLIIKYSRFKPLIIGKIEIKANAIDNESGINHVEFYIDNELKYNDTEYPYSYEWKKDKILGSRQHTHTIKVVAYDNYGNSNYDEITVGKYL